MRKTRGYLFPDSSLSFSYLLCILLITFSLVNSSLSFSSKAFEMLFVNASNLGMVIFFSALARFWVFLIFTASR